MRESRSSGSVEGVMGNRDSYSDSFPDTPAHPADRIAIPGHALAQGAAGRIGERPTDRFASNHQDHPGSGAHACSGCGLH